MKSIVLLFTAFVLTLTASAQFTFSTGELVEKRPVKPFRSIKTGDGIEVILVQGDEHAVAVSAARSEYVQRLKTEVADGVLKIYYDRESLSDWVSSGKKLKAYVAVRTLDRLVAVAGSHVNIQGTLKEEAVTFLVQSGASVTGKMEAGKLVVEAESGARMDLTGAAGLLSISANSGAKVDATGVSAGKADIRCTTGAKIEIKANDEMKFFAATGGSIYYAGNGKIISVEKKTGSVIRKAD
jgi:hypothetical protein